MKTYLIYIGLLTPVFSLGQGSNQRIIQILSVNFYTTTTISIPCKKFEANFRIIMDTTVVHSKDSIKLLDKLISTVKFSKENTNIDTRAKIIFLNRYGKRKIICLGMFDISIDGKTIAPNKQLSKFVRSLIPKKQFK